MRVPFGGRVRVLGAVENEGGWRDDILDVSESGESVRERMGR